MTMHGRWEAFRGKSKEKNDLLFTAKKSKLFQFKTELDIFLGNNKGEVPDFKVKEGYSKSCAWRTHPRDYAFIVALVVVILDKINANHDGDAVHGRHTLAIMPNVDYAFIVALVVVIIDRINANHDGDAAIN
ncbi:PREDICTED: protein LURP-one-related 15-like, partial [Populus euphratica]|uniref:Protein LURP-one-related 15-like n=1 Tax=Populus euphratica TaxID=75702 RepID=A0AAJ6TTH1_POPEU